MYAQLCVYNKLNVRYALLLFMFALVLCLYAVHLEWVVSKKCSMRCLVYMYVLHISLSCGTVHNIDTL
jgi:hypothetical protein